MNSRVHPLRLGIRYGVQCFVKREDELGGLFGGSKTRKYCSLIAHLKKRGIRKAALIGGQQSNQVVALSSYLIENQIEPTLFLLGSIEHTLTGNALFTHLLVPKERIQYVTRADWPQVENLAQKWQQENEASIMIPEGGSLPECIEGLQSLAYDIVRNEEELGITFREILVDAGTGLTAASLIASLGVLKKEVHVHVMLAASTQDQFHNKVQALGAISLVPYTLYTPTTAKSFGATNREVFNAIRQCAREEGFFLDPIYSAKLYLLLQSLLNSQALSSPVLFIHSGGLFSLASFQGKLQ